MLVLVEPATNTCPTCASTAIACGDGPTETVRMSLPCMPSRMLTLALYLFATKMWPVRASTPSATGIWPTAMVATMGLAEIRSNARIPPPTRAIAARSIGPQRRFINWTVAVIESGQGAILRQMVPLLRESSSAFGWPTFARALVLLCGTLLTSGQRTVAAALRATR